MKAPQFDMNYRWNVRYKLTLLALRACAVKRKWLEKRNQPFLNKHEQWNNP